MGCIPPNKTPQTTIVAFGAITDIWNVSIYIHIMNINTTALHRNITENGALICSFLRYQEASVTVMFRMKNVMLIFIAFHLSLEYHGIYYTNTI